MPFLFSLINQVADGTGIFLIFEDVFADNQAIDIRFQGEFSADLRYDFPDYAKGKPRRT